jgi:hypothetical protein
MVNLKAQTTLQRRQKMKINEMTYNRQSFFARESGSLGVRVQPNSFGWIALLSLLALLALPMATLAQTSAQTERASDPKTVKGQLPEPIVLGTSAQTVQIPGGLNVGNGRLEVVTSAIGGGVLTNNLYIRQLNQTASPAHLCWKVAPDRVPGLMLTTCTSSESSLRYKTRFAAVSGRS